MDAATERPRPRHKWVEILYSLHRRSVRFWVVTVLAAVIAMIFWLDYSTGPTREPAVLYDIPILGSAAAFGMAGVLAVATSCTAVFLLTILLQRSPLFYGDAAQIALFYLLGILAARMIIEYLRADKSQAELHALNSELEARIAEAVNAERQALQKLNDAQRLTLLGEAAAHIAHEIKNPLVSIGGFARRIRKQIPNGHAAQPGLKIIAEEVARLEAMLKELLDFASPEYALWDPVEVADVVNDVLLLAQPAAQGSGVQLAFIPLCENLSIRGDAEHLKRALLNVVLNGVQAMSDGGSLTITASCAFKDGIKSARIEVRDTGPGITPDILPRIFDPFFTTKRNGTGLGLALARKTVEAHGGRLQVDSVLDAGTSFEIWLPICAAGHSGK